MNPDSIVLLGAIKRYGSGQGEGSFTLSVPELRIERGSVNLIQGESGCGKSTLTDALGLISKLDKAGVFRLCLKSGKTYNINEQNESTLADIRRCHIGYVLQAGGLLGFMSVHDNIALSMKLAHGRVDEKHIRALVSANELNIAECLAKKPSQISLGQRQRAAIARALAHRPEIVIADEPTGAVDPERAQQIKRLLLACAREQGATTLIVTHDATLFADDEVDHVFGFEPLEGAHGRKLVQRR